AEGGDREPGRRRPGRGRLRVLQHPVRFRPGAARGALRRLRAQALTRPEDPMPTFNRRSLLAGAALLLLGACGGPELGNVAPVSFDGRSPIRLNVARIDTVDRSVPSAVQAAQSPAAAIRSWGAARLQAAGGAGAAQLIIQEASLTRETLAT